MLTVVLIFSLLTILLLSFAALRRRLFLYPKSKIEKLSPQPKAVSLFAPTAEEIRLFEKEEAEEFAAKKRQNLRQNLFLRAKDEDFTVLTEARDLDDPEFYQKLLDLLTERIKLEPKNFEKFITFISQKDLPTNDVLAKAALENWKANPFSGFLPKVLHVSALSRSAENYLNVVESAFRYSQQGKLEKISETQLVALFESHYQLLPTEVKASGAGFLIKEKLASVRREVLGK